MPRIIRLIRHLFESQLLTRRRFSRQTLDQIESAVRAAEASHAGELQVVIETDLDVWAIVTGKTSRQRSLEVFAASGVWDTEANNGVLLYILCADRHVQVVADRGFNGIVTEAEWRGVCAAMEADFRAGRWAEGVVAGVNAAAILVGRHFPSSGQRGNELPNRPILL